MQLANLVQRTALRQPDKTAMICGWRRQSWSQLMRRASRFASALHKLDITAGERLAILALNSDRYLEAQIAALWAELVLVPLNTSWSSEEIAQVIDDTTASVLLVDDAFVAEAAKLATACDKLRAKIHIGDEADSGGLLDYEELIAGADEIPVPTGTPGGEELAGIYYTGGTTGFPKGVMLSHSSLFHSGLYASVEMAYSSDEVFLHVAPMFHLADGSQAVANTLFGITQCFVPGFEAESVLQTIESAGVTSLLLLPSMIERMLDHPRFGEFDLSSLRRVIYGDSPASPNLYERAEQAVPSIELYQAYGLTEMGPLVTILRPEDRHREGEASRRAQSVGRPMVGVEVKIVDGDFRELPRGQVGRIIASGKNAMLGYWKRPTETAHAMVDGWVLTGDLGQLDEDGYLYLHDRVADAIEVGGKYVSSIEVEHALLAHPGVQAAAVIGIADGSSGLSVHAVVNTNPEYTPTESELIEHCGTLLDQHQCPASISFRSEPLPLTAPGKVLKRELRQA